VLARNEAEILTCKLFLGRVIFKKIFKNQSIKAFVDGITVAVVGALFDAVIVIATRSILVIPTALIAVATILALI